VVIGGAPAGGDLAIGFDGRALSSPAGGVRRYARELLRALVALDERLDVAILGGDPAAAAALGLRHQREPWHPPTNAGWSLVGLPRAAARADVDVLHAPAYTGPFLSPVPVVLTIHDVSYARRPEWFPYRRDPLRRAFYRRSALSASFVITDSAFSASEIREAYGIDQHRMAVVPLGVDPAFTPAADGADLLPAGVRPPYVLHVGDLHERRNLVMLAEAVVAARTRLTASPPVLVLAGVDRGVGGAIQDAAARAGCAEAVVQLGIVEEPRLRTLYRSAAALAYPSFYEGFGLPVLEAMASGTPVIAARAGSIPEVAGEAATLLDPADRDAWTDAVVRAVSDPVWRERQRVQGLARARDFTWARTARLTLEVYRRVARA